MNINVLNQGGRPRFVTGTSTQTVLAETIVPANILGNRGCLEFEGYLSWTNPAAEKILRIGFEYFTLPLRLIDRTENGVWFSARILNYGVEDWQSVYGTCNIPLPVGDVFIQGNSKNPLRSIPHYLHIDTKQPQQARITIELRGDPSEAVNLEYYSIKVITPSSDKNSAPVPPTPNLDLSKKTKREASFSKESIDSGVWERFKRSFRF